MHDICEKSNQKMHEKDSMTVQDATCVSYYPRNVNGQTMHTGEIPCTLTESTLKKRMEGGKVLCINCGILLFFPCNPEEASLTIRHTHKKCTPYGNIILCVKK